jgi:hypothetical protein
MISKRSRTNLAIIVGNKKKNCMLNAKGAFVTVCNWLSKGTSSFRSFLGTCINTYCVMLTSQYTVYFLKI